MAKQRRRNGTADITVEILKDIRGELRSLNGRVDALGDRVGALEKSTVQGFAALTARLENIRDFAGERYRDHDVRLGAIEHRLDQIEKR